MKKGSSFNHWYPNRSMCMKMQAKLDKVIQEKTELKTKLTEVSKQLKDKSASNEKNTITNG